MLETPATIDVPLRTDQDGVIRVGNTRITLPVLIGTYNQGASAEQIVEDFDRLKLEDVHAVISYYLSHRAEVDTYIQRVDDEAEKWRQEYEANNPKAIEFNARMRKLLDEKRRQDQS
ncbi:MAG: DUF433 domain-containing protein [Anaerolineaceae bacterium]|nr:DUF433 domain-containing protein [Anaerolineaceae bacterium]